MLGSSGSGKEPLLGGYHTTWNILEMRVPKLEELDKHKPHRIEKGLGGILSKCRVR